MAFLAVVVVAFVLGACVPPGDGFSVLVNNPCDIDVTIDYWQEGDPGPGDASTRIDEWVVPANDQLSVGDIGEGVEIVVEAAGLDWSDRKPAPERGGTIVFDIDPQACPSTGG